MSRPRKDTGAFPLRISSSLRAQIQVFADLMGVEKANSYAPELLKMIADLIANPCMNPPMSFDMIALREKLHGPGRSGTYIDEPSPFGVVREDPTVEERRADNLAELALLDRILGLNEKLQNQVLDLQAQLLECRNAQDRLRDENQRLREGGR
jgi:hypothetical protein